ncbi:HalOD1 output domain-containing protein [Haladaptatus sp. NG-WS-4]
MLTEERLCSSEKNETATQATELTCEIGEGESPSEAVVRATAALTNTPVIDLDPLYSVIDPDHLDGLFGELSSRTGHKENSVTFSFNGCCISVAGDTVVIRRSE